MPMILLVDFSFILEWFSEADPLFLIAQSIGMVATVLGILCVQINAPGRILVLQLVTNALVILNYLLLGSYPGCALCGVAIVHVLYNYRYIRRGKTPPRRSLYLFFVPYIASVVLTSKALLSFRPTAAFFIDLLPLGCALFFALAITQEHASRYRVFIGLNALLWLFYDFFSGAYTLMFTHGLTFLSVLIGIVRLDMHAGKHGTLHAEGEKKEPVCHEES